MPRDSRAGIYGAMAWLRKIIVVIFGLVLFGALGISQAADDYQPGPDSLPHEGVPKGDVTKYTFDQSSIFPGTTRDYWIYVPKQYDPAQPACLFVDQDGVQFKAPTVFDNLIARHEMPVTIGVFIMHGRVKAATANALDRFNRSYEYDGLGDNYARFLLEEILPEVERKTAPDGRPIHLSKDPNDRAIGGSSSGAICAFTAAWERPDAFRRVFSSIGTYVDQRGGNVYPSLIRKTEPKPLRVFLQDGSNDLNIVGGSWFLANQEMLSALEFAGYEVNHIWGEGGHNGKQATQIFPDAMRWLWQDWPRPVATHPRPAQAVTYFIEVGEPWQIAAENCGAPAHLAVNAKGEVFFTDTLAKCIRRIGLDGSNTVFSWHTGETRGMMFGPDWRLHAVNGGKEVRVYVPVDAPPTAPPGTGESHGEAHITVRGVDGQSLCMASDGDTYVTDPAGRRIWLITRNGEKKVTDIGLAFNGAICLTPDQSLLLAADSRSQFVYSFHIEADGSLTDRQPYFHLRIPDGVMESGAGGMTTDTNGNLFVSTLLGVQVCDQAGRVQGIIPTPRGVRMTSIVLGGSEFDELYAAGGGNIYKRKFKVRGALSFRQPIKPGAPRL